MRARLAALGLAVALVAYGCSEPIEVGFNSAAGAAGVAGAGVSGAGAVSGAAGTGGTPGTGGSGGSSGRAGGQTGGSGACEPVDCRGKSYQCGDCDDDDDDGLVDAADPDCLGPCDDTEDTFARDSVMATGCRQDCYFDRNSGVGNDRCAWSHLCDPQSVGPDFPPSGDAACAYMPDASVGGTACPDLLEGQPLACQQNCLPLTPNGCDCFGCCELPAGSGDFVWLGSNAGGRGTCSLSSVLDTDACRPCTPVPSCMNECDPCEICVGKPTLDASCGSAEAPCAGGLPHCSSTAGCGVGAYCITGCCVPAPR